MERETPRGLSVFHEGNKCRARVYRVKFSSPIFYYVWGRKKGKRKDKYIQRERDCVINIASVFRNFQGELELRDNFLPKKIAFFKKRNIFFSTIFPLS